MNMVIELNALYNRYSFTSFYDTYEVIRLVRSFVKKYGGKVIIRPASSSTSKRNGFMKVKIVIEYICELYNEYDKTDVTYFYVPLVLNRNVRDEAHLEVVLQEIYEAISR
jgi:sulfur relay (sulfurtransferase) DsrC/TusE family protein